MELLYICEWFVELLAWWICDISIVMNWCIELICLCEWIVDIALLCYVSLSICFVWECLCMCNVMFLHNCMQSYYGCFSHPSAVVKCSMRHCRLVLEVFCGDCIFVLLSVSALIRNTGVGNISVVDVFVLAMYKHFVSREQLILKDSSIVDFPLYSIIEVLFC